tara:strand:- start:1350 stop:3908 length:2559 start_codon:yes stop_codon:yes gene_type:complete
MSSITATQLGKFLTLQNNSGSADSTAPAGGVVLFSSGSNAGTGLDAKLYLQKEGSADVHEVGADLKIAGDSGSSTVSLGAGQTLTVAGAAANGIDTSVSGQTVTVALDLNELAAKASPVGADQLGLVDSEDSDATKKVTISNLAGLMAGTVTSTGLANSSGVLSLDIQNMTAAATVDDGDLVVIDDGAGGTLRKMTRANFIESAALDNIDIDGGAIDGAAIGANDPSTIQATTISGSSTLNVVGVSSFGPAAQTTISAAGVVSGSGASTLHQLTADRGTFTALVADTLDVNTINSITSTVNDLEVSDRRIVAALDATSLQADGGGLRVGGDASTAGHMSILYDHSNTAMDLNVGGSTIALLDANGLDVTGALSGSGDSTIHKVTMDQLVAATADINGGSIDGATIGAASQSSVKATTISGSSTLGVAGVATFGSERLTISAVGVLSGSATATLHNATLDQVTVGSADINGGNIDGTAIGATSQSSVKATTLSGSGALSVVGASSFGPGAQAVITAAGALTAASATLNGNLSGSGTLIIEGASSFGAGAQATISAVGAAVLASAKVSDLTDGRVVLAGTSGELEDSGNLTFDGSTLTITGAVSGSGNISSAAALNAAKGDFGVIGSGANQGAAGSKVGFFAGNQGSGLAAQGYSAGNGGVSVLGSSGNIQAGGSGLFEKGLNIGLNTANRSANADVVFHTQTEDNFFKLDVDQDDIRIDGANMQIGFDKDPESGYAIDVSDSRTHNKVRADAFVTYSDRNLKTDITPMTDALDRVMALEPVRYEMKSAPGKADFGFIAQDLAKVAPEVCGFDSKTGEGNAIDYGRMSALLAGAVKSQQLQIEELKTIIAKLQK